MFGALLIATYAYIQLKPNKTSLIVSGPANNFRHQIDKYILNTNKKVSTRDATNIRWAVEMASNRYDSVDATLLLSFIEIESTFNKDAVSSVGAKGLMQILPITEREFLRLTKTKTEDIFDIYENIYVGAYYLNYLIERFEGNYRLAFVAYNIGPTKVEKMLDTNKVMPTKYIDNLRKKYAEIHTTLKEGEKYKF